jgi:hypothetical protein
MTAEERQQRIRGTSEVCDHPDPKLEDIKNYGDETIGVRCRTCGMMFAQAFCVGCCEQRWCSVVSADGTERFCTQDCRAGVTAKRAKEPGAVAARRRARR